MKISECMTSDVQTVTPEQPIREAAQFMLRADTGVLPVVDSDNLIGMITDRDIAVRGVAEGHGPDTLVRELMTNDVIAARSDEDVDEVAVRMSEAQIRRLPVIDEHERLCGIISLADITQKAEEGTAELALDGITEPGGDHQQ